MKPDTFNIFALVCRASGRILGAYRDELLAHRAAAVLGATVEDGSVIIDHHADRLAMGLKPYKVMCDTEQSVAHIPVLNEDEWDLEDGDWKMNGKYMVIYVWAFSPRQAVELAERIRVEYVAG